MGLTAGRVWHLRGVYHDVETGLGVYGRGRAWTGESVVVELERAWTSEGGTEGGECRGSLCAHRGDERRS